jgi:D-beta-D-heptose 7-phosphate kinase/D-beta-D-heptose 1-phosphate adenosyltransferase
MCLGDIMLDRFYYGRIERISPEAPVPVVRMNDNRAMLGGVGNVARNISSLGGEAVLIGMVGDDMAGREIAALIEETPGHDRRQYPLLAPAPPSPRHASSPASSTSCGWMRKWPMRSAPTISATVRESITALLPGCHALIISDYAKGLLSGGRAGTPSPARARWGMPVLVDPKRDDFAFYAGATVMTPNLKELKAAARCPVETDEEVVAAASRLMAEAKVDSILVTRSEKGMLLVEAAGSACMRCPPLRWRCSTSPAPAIP